MQTRVEFTRFGHNTALGNFGPGDVAVCGQGMARHLVEQVGCARYAPQPALSAPALQRPTTQPPQAASTTTQRRAKRAVPLTQELDYGNGPR